MRQESEHNSYSSSNSGPQKSFGGTGPSINMENSSFWVGHVAGASTLLGSKAWCSFPAPVPANNQSWDLWLGETEKQGHTKAYLCRRNRSTSEFQFSGMGTEQGGSWHSMLSPSRFHSSWVSYPGSVAETWTTAWPPLHLSLFWVCFSTLLGRGFSKPITPHT